MSEILVPKGFECRRNLDGKVIAVTLERGKDGTYPLEGASFTSQPFDFGGMKHTEAVHFVLGLAGIEPADVEDGVPWDLSRQEDRDEIARLSNAHPIPASEPAWWADLPRVRGWNSK